MPQLRPGDQPQLVRLHQMRMRRHYPDVDLVRVQDAGLSGHEDPDVLAWAADNGRIILTNDKRTMIAFARQRVDDGLPMPGVFEVGERLSIRGLGYGATAR